MHDRKDWYFSIGGEMRQRYEFYHNPGFVRGPSDKHGNSDSLLQRYFLHDDLHVGQHLRFFGQLMASLENGRTGGPRPEIDRNVFDLHQGFMDFILPLNSNMLVTWRLGRQEFEYGSGRLISVREVPNTRRSFDAARVLFRVDKWAIDGFWGKPVRNRFHAFDDDPDPDKSLRAFTLFAPIHFCKIVISTCITLVLRTSKAYLTRAHELRHTLGKRLWGKTFAVRI